MRTAVPTWPLLGATALLMTAVGCGGPEAPPTDPDQAAAERPAPRRGKGAKGKRGPDPATLEERVTFEGELPPQHPLRTLDELGDDEPAFVTLVILDTLRADRANLCGYERPNTPVLNALRDLGATVTCDAYSPATWTLPAHASYFTGSTTAEHGVHTLGTPLSDDWETLAETYAERGYQTMFVSANPVFNTASNGFWQGFDRVAIAKGLVGPLRGESFEQVLERELDLLSDDHPTFLVLNIFDAHDPYPPVPGSIPWARKAPRLNLLPHTADPSNPYHQFVTGNMKASDQPGYLAQIRNSYDHAVAVADRNLGVFVRSLRKRGWLKRPHRAIITSDHGEHLGEHGLLRHGSATWQTVTRVPLMVMDSTRKTPVELPSPVNVTSVYQLVLDGTLPEQTLTVESASGHNEEDFKPSWNTVSVWAGPGEKLQFFDGDYRMFDLETDPMEESPLPIPDAHPMRTTLSERVQAHEVSISAALERGQDSDMMEALKEVGYVQ